MNLKENAKAKDNVAINNIKKIIDRVLEHAVWNIKRYASKEDKLAGRVYSLDEAMKLFGAPQFSKINGNLLVNEGINELFTILCSSGGTKFDNADAVLITGTGTGAAAATDTEATFTNGVKVGMMSGYPTYGTDQKATWKSEFDGNTANQAWQEFGVLNAASSGKLLNRKVSDQGTKSSGQIWDLSLEISLS